MNNDLHGLCDVINPSSDDCVTHVQNKHDLIRVRGQGHPGHWVHDVVKDCTMDLDSVDSGIELLTEFDYGFEVDSNSNDDVNDCGYPSISDNVLRQSVVRCHVTQNGGYEWEIVTGKGFDWDLLPDYVGLTTEVSVLKQFVKMYDCITPLCCIEIIPGNYIPVFPKCFAGCCDCVYILQGVVTQLRPCQFAAYFLSFEHVCFDDWFVLTGVCRGFRIVDKSCATTYYCENYVSLTKGEFHDEMTDKVLQELQEGKIRQVHSKPRCVHALGGVVKSDGTLRPITDCSSPDDININLYMSSTCDKFHYTSLDDVVGVLERNEFCAVSDIQSAYRSVLVLPSHREFQGFQWDLGQGPCWFQDLAICFGLKCAPWIFTKISDFCVRCMKHDGVVRCFNYLDDFIVIGVDQDQCELYQQKLHTVLVDLGFKVSEKKEIAPSTEVKYLGIIVNTLDMSLSIGHDKLSRAQECVKDLLNRKWCSRRKLEQITGLLSHCSTVVKGGRTYTRRLYDALKYTDSKCRRVKLSDLAILDLRWWSSFLVVFNGKARMFDKDCPVVPLVTDASNSGFGAYTDSDFFWGFWKVEDKWCGHQESAPIEEVFRNHINVGEMWPVVAGLHRWCSEWRDCIVEVVTDNTQVQHALRTGRSSNPSTMKWLREIFWVCAFNNIYIKSTRIASKDNILADSLSRLKNVDCVTICDSILTEFSCCCRVGLSS